jgi:hypothetical protein
MPKNQNISINRNAMELSGLLWSQFICLVITDQLSSHVGRLPSLPREFEECHVDGNTIPICDF